MGASASRVSLPGGFRIHSVSVGSPASAACLDVFFDFIVEVGGIPILSEVPSFSSIIREHENEEIELTIFNLRTRESRHIPLTPRNWGGQGLVGVVGQFEHIDADSTEAIRVLEVREESPAAFAGLISGTDYIIATTSGLLRSLDDFDGILKSSQDKDLKLLVYNSISEQTRGVVIHPNPTGAIGCSVGTGILHRIPPSRSQEDTDLVAPPLVDSRSISTTDPPPQLVPFSI